MSKVIKKNECEFDLVTYSILNVHINSKLCLQQ